MWNVTLHGEVFHYGTGIARACHPAPDMLDCFSFCAPPSWARPLEAAADPAGIMEALAGPPGTIQHARRRL